MPEPARWPRTPMADLLLDGAVSYGIVQPGHEVGSGVPIVRVKDLGRGWIDKTAPMRVASDVSGKHSRTVLNGGELLLSVVGTVGLTAVVPDDLAGWNVARAIAVLRPDGTTADWLSLCLQTDEVRHQISGAVNTTVQTTLNLSDLKRLSIPTPPLATQQAISGVLGALDDKIDANAAVLDRLRLFMTATVQRANARVTLGELASHRTTALQPEAFDDQVSHYSLPAFDSGALPQRVARESVQSGKFELRSPSLLIAKLNPRIPRIWDVPSLPDGMSVASTEFVVLEPVNCSTSALWAAVSQPAFSVQLQSKAAGTSGSHQRVRPADMLAVHILDPRTLDAADAALLEDLGKATDQIKQESKRLATTRDELLPLLMSGRITVRDAEAAV